MPVTDDDRVLIDYRTSDDAGVYRLDEDRALVQTVDFFTPIVDDAFTYGRIAAANALSDVYAMGGRPLTALAIAGFPKDADRQILKDIFAGGLATLREAGTALLGGHTVQDSEIKFGYAVTGQVRPDRVLANAGAHPGDILFLTKPIGTGVIATALKFNRATPAAVDAAIASMTALNRDAAEAIQSLPKASVHACTDITGFGLVGHATEMAIASQCAIELWPEAVPLIPGAVDLVAGNIPGGGRTNRQYFASLEVAAGVSPAVLDLMFDPQTSGGLLIAAAAAAEPDVAAALSRAGVPARAIGRAVAHERGRILVRERGARG